jgi:hypothetical protein
MKTTVASIPQNSPVAHVLMAGAVSPVDRQLCDPAICHTYSSE